MKYNTLADLVNAYHSHELTAGNAVMFIDNDTVGVTCHDADDEDWEHAVDVFEMHPHNLLKQALDLLGIPYECS